MPHVVLLGDSIFDNARYVPGGPSVIEHLRKCLPSGWTGTLIAVDGSIASQVEDQLIRIPDDATHLVVSVGGNNALENSHIILSELASPFDTVVVKLNEIREAFQGEYRRMLQGILSLEKPTIVCTIYDCIPNLGQAEQLGLSLFNEVILREAFRANVPVIDLRLVCSERTDYSPLSPIEPSVSGGGKIARIISLVVSGHDFDLGGCRIYV